MLCRSLGFQVDSTGPLWVTSFESSRPISLSSGRLEHLARLDLDYPSVHVLLDLVLALRRREGNFLAFETERLLEPLHERSQREICEAKIARQLLVSQATLAQRASD